MTFSLDPGPPSLASETSDGLSLSGSEPVIHYATRRLEEEDLGREEE